MICSYNFYVTLYLIIGALTSIGIFSLLVSTLRKGKLADYLLISVFALAVGLTWLISLPAFVLATLLKSK